MPYIYIYIYIALSLNFTLSLNFYVEAFVAKWYPYNVLRYKNSFGLKIFDRLIIIVKKKDLVIIMRVLFYVI